MNTIKPNTPVIVAVAIIFSLINLDASVIYLVLPPIASKLHSTLNDMQWFANAYLFSAILVCALSGKLGSLFGLKKVCLAGIGLFLVGSLFAGISMNNVELIFSRALQGIGFGFSFTVAILIMMSSYPKEKRGKAIGTIIAVGGLSQALGPSIGGLLVSFLGWRSVFLINIPLALMSFYLLLSYYQPDADLQSKRHIDYLGAILLAGALFLFLLFLETLSDFLSTKNLLLFIGFIILTGLFILNELAYNTPLFDIRFFLKKIYSQTCIVRILYMWVGISSMFIIPILLQNLYSFSALKAGMILSCMGIAYGFSSFFIGRVIDKIGYSIPIVQAMFLTCFAMLVFISLSFVHSLPLLIFGLILLGICTATVLSATPVAVADNLPQEHVGSGIGIFYTLAFTGSVLGVAITTALLHGISKKYFLSLMHSDHITFGMPTLKLAQSVANGSQPISTLLLKLESHQAKLIAPLAKQAFSNGFLWVMIVNFLLGLVALYFAFQIKRNLKRRSTHVNT